MTALIDAIEAVAAFAMAHSNRLEELDVNPLLALPQSAIAVDALIRGLSCERARKLEPVTQEALP